MTDINPTIILEYKNQRPVDLLDFTASLAAFGEEFKRFSALKSPDSLEPRLQVQEMRPGSIIAELIPLLQQVDFIIEHRQVVAGFMANWAEIIQLIARYSPAAKDIDKPTIRAARDFIQPIAKDNGSQLNITASDGGQIINNFNIDARTAIRISRNAENLLGPPIPEEMRFEDEPMTLFQMRDGPPSAAGDKGIIDRFTDKPKKLTFGSAEAKDAILHNPENPFELIFFVSGFAKTAAGQVAAYHIQRLEGVEPREG